MLIQYITVKILQKINLLPRSCAGDYKVYIACLLNRVKRDLSKSPVVMDASTSQMASSLSP